MPTEPTCNPTQAVRNAFDAGPMFDSAIVQHGFTDYMRDYDIIVDVPAANPVKPRTSYVEGRYRYRFSHAVFVEVRMMYLEEIGPYAWDDVFTDYATWQ